MNGTGDPDSAKMRDFVNKQAILLEWFHAFHLRNADLYRHVCADKARVAYQITHFSVGIPCAGPSPCCRLR